MHTETRSGSKGRSMPPDHNRAKTTTVRDTSQTSRLAGYEAVSETASRRSMARFLF